MRRSAAPIIATIVLLLPVLYVGSYLALVVPRGIYRMVHSEAVKEGNYRVLPDISARVFWPLEQIDRQIRPIPWMRKRIPVRRLFELREGERFTL